MDKKYFSLLCGAVLTAVYASSSVAAPMAAGTQLKLTAGTGSGFSAPCVTGSCFGMEVAPNLYFWVDLLPGNDGGFILGKNQASGGQDLAPSASNTTQSDIVQAWNFGGSYGTNSTTSGGGAATNIFDDANCANTGCLGKTDLKVWDVAWNKNLIPMGSAAPCELSNCTADQKAGIFITKWEVNPVNGGAWTMAKNAVVPKGVPGFENFRYQVLLRGTVVIPLPAAVWLFGSGLLGLAAVTRRKKKI